jgi:hypothetical protein
VLLVDVVYAKRLGWGGFEETTRGERSGYGGLESGLEKCPALHCFLFP